MKENNNLGRRNLLKSMGTASLLGATGIWGAPLYAETTEDKAGW